MVQERTARRGVEARKCDVHPSRDWSAADDHGLLSLSSRGVQDPRSVTRGIRSSATRGRACSSRWTAFPDPVNTADDAVETGPGETIIPGYQARDWVFVKEEDSGTSVVHAVFNWDSDNPADYLMLGTWAWFPDQKRSDLSLFEGPQRTGAIVDGPEIDPRYPPDMPLSGTATYSGRASGFYRYDQSEERRVHDEYEGTVTLTADFGDGTVEGCIGCVGDIVTRVSRLDILRGREVDEQPADLTDYEIHLNATPYNSDGTFGPGDATVEHPTRDITTTEGVWVGFSRTLPTTMEILVWLEDSTS